jgi:LemA protein
MGGFIIFLVIILILVVIAIVFYNSLVSSKNQVEDTLAQIDVQLKRRHDLIPNLVETVKGYADFEKSTLENVIQARNSAAQVDVKQDIQKAADAENALTGTLSKLFALTENYPDLKANQSFLELQRELSDTENKVAASRQIYNQTVRDYNTKIDSVPTNFIAQMFSFKKAEYFEIENAEEREAPEVKF